MFVPARDNEGNLFSRDITQFGDLNLKVAVSDDGKYGISLNNNYSVDAIYNTKEEAEEQIYNITNAINNSLISSD